MNNSNTKTRQRKHKFTRLSSTQLAFLIDEWILDERSRLICKMKFIDNKTYEQIGEDERIDLTDRQVKNIVRKCSSQIQSHIEDFVTNVRFEDLIPKQV